MKGRRDEKENEEDHVVRPLLAPSCLGPHGPGGPTFLDHPPYVVRVIVRRPGDTQGASSDATADDKRTEGEPDKE